MSAKLETAASLIVEETDYGPKVRSALYAAANIVMTRSTKPSSLKAWGNRLAKSKGRKRALVAVARKLAVILHTMWIDGTEFCMETREAA